MSSDPNKIRQEILSGLIVSIDGPSGSGKSTTARAAARELSLKYVDTGAMYRAVTQSALVRGVALDDGDALGKLARELDIVLEPQDEGDVRVLVDGEDYSREIRTQSVTAAVSEVSAHPAVREAMVRLQRRAARDGGAVLEGRDIGSVVLPWADVKIYLVADVAVRAERRRAQLLAAGEDIPVLEIEADLRRRDEHDSNRETSPLQRPIGAWVLDTSGQTIAGQVSEVVRRAGDTVERLARLREPRAGMPSVWKRRLVFLLASETFYIVARTIFGMKVYSRMDRHLEESFIFSPNHISNVDPPFVGSTTHRELHFVAKSGLFKVGWFAWLLRLVNAFPIRRGVFDREAMGISMKLLEEGHSLTIFPEGGRVLGGELGKPRSGVGYLAINSGVPVVPAYVVGSDRLRRCMFRRMRLEVIHGRPIRIPPEIGEEYRAADDRNLYRRYAEMVMSAIVALREELEDL